MHGSPGHHSLKHNIFLKGSWEMRGAPGHHTSRVKGIFSMLTGYGVLIEVWHTRDHSHNLVHGPQ